MACNGMCVCTRVLVVDGWQVMGVLALGDHGRVATGGGGLEPTTVSMPDGSFICHDSVSTCDLLPIIVSQLADLPSSRSAAD